MRHRELKSSSSVARETNYHNFHHKTRANFDVCTILLNNTHKTARVTHGTVQSQSAHPTEIRLHTRHDTL